MTIQAMSPRQAGNLMRVAQDALKARCLKPADYAVLGYLMFRARQRETDRCKVSLTTIGINLPMRRAAIVASILRLSAAGLLTKVRAWIWVLWQGKRVKRQDTNTYVFNTSPPEFRGRTVFREDKKESGVSRKKSVPTGEIGPELAAALASLGAGIRKAEADTGQTEAHQAQDPPI